MRHLAANAAALLCLTLIVSPARAAEEDPPPPPDESDPGVVDAEEEVVEIFASRALEEEPTAVVDQVSREDIEASGARTAADALRLVPGVTIETGARGEARLQVRGFDHRQVQVLVDGIPLSNPYDGGLDLASLSVATIDSIQVGRGAASSAYGGGALGGTVDITTTGPPRDPTFQLRAGGGSSANLELLAAGGAALGPVRVGVGWELRNRAWDRMPHAFPERRNEAGGRRNNSDRRDQTLHAALGVGDALAGLQLRATMVDVRRGVPPHISDSRPRYWRWDLWRDNLISLHGHALLGTRVSLRGAGFLRLRNDTLDIYDDATYATQETSDAASSSYRDVGAGGFGKLEVDLGRENLVGTTLSYRHDLHRSQADLGEDWRKRDGDTISLAPYALLKPLKPLTVEAGVGVHLWQPRDSEEVEHRKPAVVADPRVGVVLRARPELAFRVAAGRRTRFPTLKEIYTTQLGYLVPNPDLRPEHAWTVDVGASVEPWQRRVELGVTGYGAFVEDLIERTYDEEGNRTYTNIRKSRHLGVEVRLVVRPTSWLEIEGGYDGMHARDTTDDGGGTRLEYRPEHRARFRGHVATPFGLRANVVLTVVGTRHYVAVETTGELEPLPAYARLDVSLSQELGKGFSLYVRGTNLTDALYEEEVGYPRPGIEVLGGVQFRGSVPTSQISSADRTLGGQR